MLSILRAVRDRLDQIGAEPDPEYDAPKPTWEKRPGEQNYAKLFDPQVQETNRYGRKIDLLDLSAGALPKDASLRINQNPAVGENPNRYKQHGFHFTSDNCIGCHACEAACSEKNGNPAHISFRSVGYVEGGTYPDYKRMNISMACNHCDDPVCLKGCPTRAYTKHAEYGAVLQDPDTCFGCGYCTWVCPYNAPQLDPIQGQVSKCNMCVDRLEEGLKPACVSACLGNALNFGVIENTPENREQVLPQIPGFPDPSITNPNIRFQQTKSMPNEVTRTDSMPVKYAKGDDGQFRSVVDEKEGKETAWNFARLSSRENPLVIFTLATQAVIGAFIAVYLAPWLGLDSIAGFESSLLFIPMLAVFMGLQLWGLVLSTMHLGKPFRFYRGFNNLRYSPVSREGLGIALFLTGLGAYTFFKLVNIWLEWGAVEVLAQLAGGFAAIAGLVGLWYMHKSYRIKARPFWNHWQVITSFFGTMFSLGSLLLGLFLLPVALINGTDISSLITVLGAMALIGFAAEGLGLIAHAKYLNVESGEGAASHYVQCTTFGKTYALRNGLIAASAVLALTMTLLPVGIAGVALYAMLLTGGLSALLMGRALFYVLVIPTTMPGAFFWKNKGFEEHARDVGLANMPQVGVVPHLH
ncbi:DmsC/YnfH family molybdoenzyme membrane anchor subunit [Ketobacter alkanivorans]|uniref:Aspartate carbamoyltransferase n=1 Tax=Ketobacter alkanivorans TaxID=1917421 RepID=A0A2K9LN03_9GAMM|nr:DmsC/YnfH family molybdoenzyme membrane anchor subunit [Ketobacter alkanivorans]AUM13736.1 aspartate carbamoyltransferase [Ketobacter alkanivorans]